MAGLFNAYCAIITSGGATPLAVVLLVLAAGIPLGAAVGWWGTGTHEGGLIPAGLFALLLVAALIGCW